jgi:hypothetical protein
LSIEVGMPPIDYTFKNYLDDIYPIPDDDFLKNKITAD